MRLNHTQYDRNLETLLEELESFYPPKCVGEDETLRQADRYAGKVELIRDLRCAMTKLKGDE